MTTTTIKKKTRLLSTTITAPSPASPEIDTPIFLDQMARCWEGYGNALSPGLLAEWETLCNIFNESMQKPGLYSLNATMGLGKSLASQVACAVLTLKSWNPTPFDVPTRPNYGALLVVERQDTAEDAAEMINQVYNDLGGLWGEPAIAKHSGNDVSFAEIQDKPVLVICHSSYTNSLQRFSDGRSDKFVSFTRWNHGTRQLVIIDESINPIQDYVLGPQDVHTVMGWFTSTQLPAPMKREFPLEYRLLKGIAELLENLEIQDLNRQETTVLFRSLISKLPAGKPISLHSVGPEDRHAKKCQGSAGPPEGSPRLLQVNRPAAV